MQRKTSKWSESKELKITPEREDLVPLGDVVGCLAIHIKNCRHFTSKIDLQHYNNLYIHICINNIVKCTKLCSLLPQNTLSTDNESKSIIKFDEVKYFSVQVPRRHDDARNNIYIDLMQYDNKEKDNFLLARVQVHLYEVIQKGCFTEEFQMLNQNIFICSVEVEFMFSYGNFGYGFSHQLKPLQKTVEPSMFMNIAPPPERTDPVTNVIIPQSIEYPAFLSPDLKVTVGMQTTAQSNQPSVVQLQKLQQKPRERLEKMKKEYRDLPTWREKAMYLERVLTPKFEHSELKTSNINEVLETQFEKKPEDIISDTTSLNKEDETIPSESSYYSFIALPNCVGLMQDKSYGWLNTNKRGKSVFFSQKERNVPFWGPEYIEFNTKYQGQKRPLDVLQSNCDSGRQAVPLPMMVQFYENSDTKGDFDSFLKNINNKMSVRKLNDRDMSKCGNILSAEIIEYEDQDPPYSTHSKMPRPPEKTWPHGLDTTTTKTVDSKDNLACDPSITTIKNLDTKNKLKERPLSVSLPNFEGESSLTGHGNGNTCSLSKSLSLTSQLENLKQSSVLKSSLRTNLQDLSEKLFSKPEVPMHTEARKQSPSSLCLSVHNEPPCSWENKIFEKIQDLSIRLSKEDILNSKSFLSPVMKDIPAVSLSGNSTDVEREKHLEASVSEKHLEARERAFPIKKKSSFKTKHLESEVFSPEPSFSDITHDYIIKQIFTARNFSELERTVEESNEIQMNWKNQLPTAWENLSPNILVLCKEKDDKIELPEAKSVISQIIQAFPVDTLLESGIIKVMELDEEYQKSSLLDTETVSVKEKPKDSTNDYSEIKNKTDSLSKQNIPIIPKQTTSFFNRIKFIDKGQNTSPQDSKYQSTPNKKTDLPSNREENGLSSTLENLSNLLMGELKESDVIMLNFLFKNIFNAFLEYNQSEKRRQPEKELERLIQHPFPNNGEDLEEIKENFDIADKSDRKPSLNPKLRVFLEALSESEIKHLKSELSKHIQHYLVERLSESGHITKEDLPKIYQNLYMMNEEAEPGGQNVFLEKYSETVKETISFVNSFNHHFIDKHLEIKLRSFLNEVLQNYFLKNLSESSLFKDTESGPMHSNVSSLQTKSGSISFYELGQDISKGSFGRSLEIHKKYPLNKSLQNHLIALSENELLNLKADLSKYLQGLFIEKLSKSGLITERQLEGIRNHINLVNFGSTPLKCIKPDLSFRGENQFMEEHLIEQNKYSKIIHEVTLQKVHEDRVAATELTIKEEKESFSLQNIKENSSIIREAKKYYSKERAKTPTLIKEQPSFNKNTQAISSKKPSERRTDIGLKKQSKEHGFMQFPQTENVYLKGEIQDPHNWSDKSKITQANACFERTLKMKSLEKKEHNIYKWMIQEKSEAVLSLCPKIPYCKMPNEDEEYINKLTFPSWQRNSLTHFKSEARENSKLEDRFCQRLKGHNNNNKKQHLVTIAPYEKEVQALYMKLSEICNEKCAKTLESQWFEYKVVEPEKNSKPSLFPEVLKRENLKPKVQKERDRINKQKKSVKILPTTPPTARTARKSVPRTLIHWTARKNIHDCSDRSENLHTTSFHHLEKVKSRARLFGKSLDDSHGQLKHFARPCTAPGTNQPRESYTGKFTRPQMVSAGLVHLNDTIPDYEIHKMQPKKSKRKC